MNPLIIFGASTRAAAFSAIRAGFDPICGDMFADADLRAFATVLDVPHYPHKLSEAIQHLPALPWIYTGALENSSHEVDRVCERHRLWGNSLKSLHRCRNPWVCRDVLWQARLPALSVIATPPSPEMRGNWVMKPFRSAAGRAITVWNADTQLLDEPHYFQKAASGVPIAAAFLATSDSATLLGISQQLIGRAELNAPEFGYCGSIFPWRDGTSELECVIRQIGSVISRECGLQGLFGIDFISDGQTPWMTEVNPRYTASMELIEYQRQIPLLTYHRQACEGTFKIPHLDDASPARGGTYCGKVVLYADRTARAPDLSAQIPRSITLTELPELADIPLAGTEIFPGQPVFTCLGEGDDPDQLFAELVKRAHQLWETFPQL